jgi:hypothetical protein
MPEPLQLLKHVHAVDAVHHPPCSKQGFEQNQDRNIGCPGDQIKAWRYFPIYYCSQMKGIFGKRKEI